MDDVAKLDLNLLQVFDALMQDGNLTRAGFRLGLSQPAMSHALGRLRKIAGDALFVRVPTGMEPTGHALRIAPAVREGLRLLHSAVQGDALFDPATCERTFNILMSDIGELVYLPRLVTRLTAIAPGVNVRVLQLAREAYAEAFFTGEADLAVGFLPGLKGGFYQQRLFSDSYVCLVRTDHPRIRRRLSLEQFVAESHVLIEPGGSTYRSASHQTSTTTLIERYLAERHLSRRVALRVPHFMVVPNIVQSTDLIATVPGYVIKHTPPRPELKTVQLPFTVPRFEVKQYWHQRNQDDVANRWLREVVAGLFTQQ
ncbi:LysR family transcriptional regulator [Ramlibacter sp. AW1]|uniref:LysR family transcriptional regulator n=1 Tax=Ramlibacter aurantiacus TaxID=2801330 RepID=A0A936ZFK8_9BURK|nr:LysR family transcriptional regulator [Ramlibacter aurantiacus]MBL0419368.1 LysR family transcriptional regulator [Ramlibacter aurantiacus]